MKAHKRAMKRQTVPEEAWFDVRVDIDKLALIITTNFSDGSSYAMVLNAKESAMLAKELVYGTASLESIVQHKKK